MNLLNPHSVTSVNQNWQTQAISQPLIMFNNQGNGTDGSAITDPYAATYFDESDGSGTVPWATVAKDLREQYGRILTNGGGCKSLELAFYFSTAAATATFQLFGFWPMFTSNYVNIAANGRASMVEVPTGSGIYLGPSYAILRDPPTSAQTLTVTAFAELNKIALPATVAPYPTNSNRIVVPSQADTTYYGAQRAVFDADFYGYLVYVTAVSAGGLVIAGRTF